jgi:hypothetical protein
MWRLDRVLDNVATWIAWHLVPRRVAYWCTIRLGVHASGPKYPTQIVPELTVADALQRWRT